MAIVIKLKKSETALSKPTTNDIIVGEVAINALDQRIFVRDSNDNIVTIGEAGGKRHENATVVYKVTVATKDDTHRYYNSGSSDGYKIDGSFSPTLELTAGNTYKFDQSDSSNTGHPLVFYYDSSKTTSYTAGVTTAGTPGSSGAYTQIVISDTTPTVLHYQCSSHSLMGNQVVIGTRNLTGFNTDELTEGSNNLYYTDGRVDTRISNASIDDLSDVDTSTTSPSAGDTLVWDNANSVWKPSAISTGSDVTDATAEPMGHADRTQSTISFDGSTRIFSIAPISSSFDVWCVGTKYTKNSTETVTLPTTSGFYYIYYDSSGVLSYKTTYFTWHTDTPTAYVYYNADSTTESFLFDERHGITLDWATHEYLHRTRGAVIANGLSASYTTLTGDGSSDDHYKVKVANGTFFDEDLEVAISHHATPSSTTDVFDQYINPSTGGGKFPVLYRVGSSGLYRLSTGSDVTEAPYRIASSVPQYNLNTAGTWSLANVGNNKYFGMWLVATNTVNSPIIAINGQTVYDNLTQAENNESWSSLNLDGLPLVEYRPLYRLIFEYNSTYANTGKTALRHVLDVRELGAAAGAYGVVQNDHGSLFGLGDDDHSQYVHLDVARTITADHTFSGDIILSTGSIISSSNSDINITPNGTGNVTLGNLTFDADQTVGASQDNYVLAYNHSNSHIVLTALSGGGGPIALNDLTDVSTANASTGDVLTVQSDASFAFQTPSAAADDSFINAIIFG